MKLVSQKNLLASLLGIALIAIKIMTFDGLHDLVWIALLGYLVIQSLTVAFSREAHDEDVKQALQGKALYRDLFGSFAFIAPDIPLIAILLGGLLAAFCPVTALLRVALGALLVTAVGYALWFSWYVAKHKRLRMESGQWGEAALNAEEKQIWKRADRWHGAALAVLGILSVLYLIFGDPRIYLNHHKLEDALTELSSGTVTLEGVVPFDWTTVYTFDPYTSKERIQRVTGSRSPALKESVSEGMTHFVCMDHGRVTASVCAHPASIGYALSFTGGRYTYYDYPDGGYAHIEYGDQVEFEVTQENGIVRLYAVVEE